MVLTLYFNPKINKNCTHNQFQIMSLVENVIWIVSLYEKLAELVTSEEGKDISEAEHVILEFVIHRGAKSRV